MVPGTQAPPPVQYDALSKMAPGTHSMRSIEGTHKEPVADSFPYSAEVNRGPEAAEEGGRGVRAVSESARYTHKSRVTCGTFCLSYDREQELSTGQYRPWARLGPWCCPTREVIL
ncbi:hypothetical protein XELAEV_18039570mg [Xenopus laevis]|uniref:Uncharacterized protein n=1 Tax=Xenopus laevis TaxID=8355 RepID=A0A974C806_XENLA|nr:hypothetical protein XELAEV_18039570mg [Xenopus laevis]